MFPMFCLEKKHIFRRNCWQVAVTHKPQHSTAVQPFVWVYSVLICNFFIFKKKQRKWAEGQECSFTFQPPEGVYLQHIDAPEIDSVRKYQVY